MTGRDRIHVYGTAANGAHAVSVDIHDGLDVLVRPSSPEHDAEAVALAKSILSAKLCGERLRLANEEIQRLNALVAREQAALRHALTGNRRFFGTTLMLPELAGDWSGPVWLYDPDKRESGFGLRFPSLIAVRESYPELWVVGVRDGGVLLDAAPLTPRPWEPDK